MAASPIWQTETAIRWRDALYPRRQRWLAVPVDVAGETIRHQWVEAEPAEAEAVAEAEVAWTEDRLERGRRLLARATSRRAASAGDYAHHIYPPKHLLSCPCLEERRLRQREEHALPAWASRLNAAWDERHPLSVFHELARRTTDVRCVPDSFNPIKEKKRKEKQEKGREEGKGKIQNKNKTFGFCFIIWVLSRGEE
jgi:hypothetical protein